jgi:hypothetical protein
VLAWFAAMIVGVYNSRVLCVAIITKDSTAESWLAILSFEKSWSCAAASKPFE